MTDGRRIDEIKNRHDRLVEIMRELAVDGVLIFDPANFAWLTAGTHPYICADPAEPPALFYLNTYRWVLCANADTQRIFDAELDGMGFQVKEWPWHSGREQLLSGLVTGRRMASDVRFPDCLTIEDRLRSLRRVCSPWDQERLRDAGFVVAHALEATCRNIERGDSEMEVAGHLAHRLIRRGAEPVSIHVAADGRLRHHRRPARTTAQVQNTCVIQTTARAEGLYLSASRTISFEPPDETMRQDHDLAVRLAAVQVVASFAGNTPANALAVAVRFLAPQQREHEWRLAPFGWLTGPAPVELALTPESREPLPPGAVLVWNAAVGCALNTDTFLILPDGHECVTPTELWPLKRMKIDDRIIDRPDILIR